MIDRQRSGGLPKVSEGRQRHLRALAGDHIHTLQRIRRELVAGIDFQHDVILVQRLVDGRNLLLAESVIENVVDLLWRDPQTRSRVAIDDDVFLQSTDLLIAVHVLELGNLAKLLQELGRPFVQFVQVLARKRVLKLGVGLAAADLQILHCLEVQRRAGNMRQLGAQPGDHLVGADLASFSGLRMTNMRP